MGIFRIGQVLYARYKGKDGKWTQRTTGFRVGQEVQAQAWLEQMEAMVEAGEQDAEPMGGAATVDAYGKRWLKKRQALNIEDWKNDESRLRNHVNPIIGKMELAKVRPRHLIQLFEQLRTSKTPPAPKTIYNIYSVLKALFRDAFKADLILANPCVLDAHDLGPIEDKHPEWRDTAVFTRVELERLIGDKAVPADRRMVYALEGLGALRHGELAALQWRDYTPEVEPLGELFVWKSNKRVRTKTGKRRWMPVHPVLAAMLAEWKIGGWAVAFGREPTPEDLVVPVTKNPKQGKQRPVGSMRTRHYSRAWLLKDLTRLGMRHRRGHDLRRTMISLAQADGADPDKLYRVTHNPKGRGTMIERYTSHEWAILCAEVAKLKVSRKSGSNVVPLGER